MHGMPFYMYKEDISDSIAVHIFEERQKTMLFSGKGNLPYPVVKKIIYNKNDVSSHKSFWLNGASRK